MDEILETADFLLIAVYYAREICERALGIHRVAGWENWGGGAVAITFSPGVPAFHAGWSCFIAFYVADPIFL